MRKKFEAVFCAIALLAGLLPVITITAKADASLYQPIKISSGFNIDMIVNGSSYSSLDCGFDDQSATYYSSDYATYGLPASGTIISNSTYYAGATYQLANYESKNALFLFGSSAYNFKVNGYSTYPSKSSSFTGANTDGTLTLATSGSYEKLLFLASSANGNSEFTATVHFTDGTTYTTDTFSVYDWCTGNGSYVALNGLGRVFPYYSAYNSTQTVGGTDYQPAKLYDCFIDLSDYKNKLVESVSFHMTSDNNERAGIFALSGKRPEATTAAPGISSVTVIDKTSFTATWDAVSGATGYNLDVATDENFTNMVSGYNNLNVGNVTSKEVTGLTPGTTYYYRVRSVNDSGSSFSSETVEVQTTGGADAASNAVSAGPATLTVGDSFTLTAAGDRQGETGTTGGETRYIPVSWTSTETGKSGSFAESNGTYTSSYTPSAYGSYTVTATYKLQTFDGSSWADTAGSIDTKTVGVTVYGTKPSAPTVSGEGSVISYEYAGEKILFDSSKYEVYTAESGGTAVAGNITAISPGGKLYIREKAKTYIPAGDWSDITVPTRPAAPTTVTAVDETYLNESDGQLTGVTSAMEYMASGGSSWTAVTSDQESNGITGLAPGTYEVRYKAVTTSGSEAFASGVQEITIDAGSTITVTFDSEGGSTVAAITGKAYGDRITAPGDPAKEGYNFAGWFKDETYTHVWAFGTDTLAGNTTLYAKWSAVPTYTVSGTAVDGSSNPVADATVKLVKGTVEYGAAVTDTYGDFEIARVPAGTYNLIITKGEQQVILKVEVLNGDKAVGSVALPSKVINSKLVIKGDDTPDVLVDKLNEEANSQIGNEDTSVEITLTVEEKDPDSEDTGCPEVTAEVTSAGQKTGMLLDITVQKSIDGGTASNLSTTDNLIQIIIPLPDELQGKRSYSVYRYHDGGVDEITGTPSDPDGEYLEVDSAKTQITLHVKKFSTYGIAYTNYSASYYQITAKAGDGGTISPESASVISGGSSTFTVTADEGYKISDVLVDGRSVGAVSTYTFTSVGSAHTIKAVFEKDAGGWTNPYSDVADTDWYYDAVRYVKESGLMNGVGTDSFGPGLSTTRGMIITILYRLEDEPAVLTQYTFKDVESGKYYAAAVAWGSVNGIIKGYDADSYGPDDNITREQLAAILNRYARYKGSDVTVIGDLSAYPDAGSVSDWALANVQWAVGGGLMTGTDTGELLPRNECTRAQAAVMLTRFACR